MLWDPHWGLVPPGFLLLSHEPGQSRPLWGLRRLRFCSPLGHFHRHSHQEAATEPIALAKAFIETLKTIPKPPTGGRSVERQPCRPKVGLNPAVGDKNSVLEGSVGADGYQVSLGSSPLSPANPRGRGIGLGLGSSERDSCGPTVTDQDAGATAKPVLPPKALGTHGAGALGPEPEPGALGVESRLGGATGDPWRAGVSRGCDCAGFSPCDSAGRAQLAWLLPCSRPEDFVDRAPRAGCVVRAPKGGAGWSAGCGRAGRSCGGRARAQGGRGARGQRALADGLTRAARV